MLEKLEGLANKEYIIATIRKGTIIMDFNVSQLLNLDENRGAVEWVITLTESYRYTHGYLPTKPKLVKTYISDLKGIYAILSLMEPVCQIYQSKKGEVEIVCNNEQVI